MAKPFSYFPSVNESDAEGIIALPAPQEIIELVDQFSRRINEYRSSLYNETELRNEFVNPFFAALGWDMKNRQGLAGDLKEVKVEESIRVEESVKNPDYSFRLGRSRKFFVETKKPSINIEAGIYPAFQLRRYAWSARLSLSILTDFEEFAVYDCRAEPNKTDKPGKGRLVYLQYDQYVERWDEIAALFSKEAVLAGSLERFIEAIPEKRGNKRVDAALLDEISGWREALAASLARRNPDLSQSDLNFAVQRTIDRLLFLRICEDRAIEEYGRLKALLQEDGVYARLMEIFREADQRYNSGIFHFQEERDRAELPDSLTGALVFDDATLKDIIRDLYYPDSPYVFSEIPAEILGQVYEQFLGKVIRLEEEHRAVVEDKPEVRKAGGVYYTPSYIVEYIVKNTVGRLLEGKSASEAAEIRILDPACGSGSFLIGAYQYLLDWHLQWYKANLAPMLDKSGGLASAEVLRLLPAAPEKRADRRARKIAVRAAQAALPITRDSIDRERHLTTSERKRILQSSIYGLDID
ncbi:MAG TPA: N-6 DNA methylase, partial [Methanothrix soehngenii]|nr:N-6 DNA methylase [Methanothrix soehngenii]